MSAWGTGNFDDDDTCDWLNSAVLEPLVQFVEDNVSSEDPVPSKEVVAAVEVLVVLYDRFEEPPPGLARVTRWRDAYLAAWETIDWGPNPGYVAERRRVIEVTFGRLIELSSRFEDLDDV